LFIHPLLHSIKHKITDEYVRRNGGGNAGKLHFFTGQFISKKICHKKSIDGVLLLKPFRGSKRCK